MKSFVEFLEYCHSLQGKELLTIAQGRPFCVSVQGGEIYFVPASSGKRRRANAEKTELVLSLLSESGEWSPSIYRTISYHASYILAIAKKRAE